MKRIKPVQKQAEPDYPSADHAGVNRRGFLQVLVGSGAAAAGAVVLGSDTAHARGKIAVPRYRVAIDLKPAFKYASCTSAVVQIIARTYHKRVEAFFRDTKERKGLLAVVRAELRRHKCADITGSDRSRVRRAVGVALSKHYKRRTGRSGRSWATLVLKSTS